MLPAALAERLAVRSDTVARRLDSGDSCAARAEAEALQAETIATLNEGRIPQRFQEELLASVTALVESIELCVAPAPAEETVTDEDDDDEDEGRGKGKGKNGKGDKGKDKD